MNTTARLLAITGALAALALVLAYLAGVFHERIDPAAVHAPQSEASAGQLVAVEAVREPVFERAAGTVQAKDETIISARITATIGNVHVRAGDRVQIGQRLVDLDARELGARVAQQREVVTAAAARLAKARQDNERIKGIFTTTPDAVSRSDVDAALAALRAAQAEYAGAKQTVDEANTRLSYTAIDAPINGTVIERFADPGDTAVPGAPLLKLYNPSLLRLEAYVRETLATRIAIDARLRVHIDALDTYLDGVVEEIVPSADPGSRAFLVKVTLPQNDSLYPGMFGRLLIPSTEAERYYVPAGAVQRMGQLEFVLADSERGLVRRYVRTGAQRADGRIEVLSGLEPGDRVALPE